MSTKKKIPPCQNNNQTVFSDAFVTDLIGHIRKSILSKCSSIESTCNDCANINECDGLLRSYLYNEAGHLEEAIKDAAKGTYKLDNNIPRFHTLAIQHLLQSKGENYSVIQWIGAKPYSASDEETYDNLDYDFLRNMIIEVLQSSDSINFRDAYFKQQKGEKRFKIRWLLVGDPKCMKNNYDYMFYTIKQLESMYGQGYYTALSWIFQFYYITENKYKALMGPLLAAEYSSMIKDMFTLDAKTLRPSFGLFGTRFMFVDGTNPETHGTIFTTKYRENDICPVERACSLFEQVLQQATQISFNDLKEQYEQILTEEPEWEQKLKETLEKKWR